LVRRKGHIRPIFGAGQTLSRLHYVRDGGSRLPKQDSRGNPTAATRVGVPSGVSSSENLVSDYRHAKRCGLVNPVRDSLSAPMMQIIQVHHDHAESRNVRRPQVRRMPRAIGDRAASSCPQFRIHCTHRTQRAQADSLIHCPHHAAITGCGSRAPKQLLPERRTEMNCCRKCHAVPVHQLTSGPDFLPSARARPRQIRGCYAVAARGQTMPIAVMSVRIRATIDMGISI